MRSSGLVAVTGVLGILLLAAGIFLSRYPIKTRRFFSKKGCKKLDLAHSKAFEAFVNWLTSDGKNGIYRAGQKILYKAEADIDLQTFYFYKFACLLSATVVIIAVRWTNIDVMRISIIAHANSGINLFDTGAPQDYEYNFSLYRAALGRIGEKNMKKLDEAKRLEAVKKALEEEGAGDGRVGIEERARTVVRAFNGVSSLKLFDGKVFLAILLSFFLPEMILLLRRVIRGNKYKKEVVKLENIFELLGSIRGFKTVYILREMSKASNVCGGQLKRCEEGFRTDRGKALEELKCSVADRRFSRLADIIRVYSMVDKKLAMEILERNKLEKEEELLLTAEEDIDIVDVIAFASVTPIIFELGNLLMKPMLDMVFQAFDVI